MSEQNSQSFKEAKEINHQKIEIHTENATSKKIKNEFDENLERSTISQSTQVNYEQIIGKNKPSESVKLTKEELLDVFFIILYAVINSNAINKNINSQILVHDGLLFDEWSSSYSHNYKDYNDNNLWHNEVNLLSEEYRTVEVY